MIDFEQWHGFRKDGWNVRVDVRNFIQKNFMEYEGDESFLCGPTQKTTAIWNKLLDLMKEERKKGILDVETTLPSSITSHSAGYIDKDNEVIVGLQTDKPLKRGIYPRGGLRMVKTALEAFGYYIDPITEMIFTQHRKTHNDGVFDCYTEEMRAARSAALLTGLPDAYGRGRIIGDYRRVALYGVDWLIRDKKEQKRLLNVAAMTDEIIRQRLAFAPSSWR